MEATPALIEENRTQEIAASQREAVISVEFVAYLALIVLALVLRIAQVDVVPLSNAEAREALAAWRTVQPDAPGSTIVPESPLLFLLHSLSFTLLGGSEFSTRIWTVLGSVGLILSPLLFRDLLGRGRAFIGSMLLAFSPVLLIASRSDSAVVWTMLFGVLALWAVWRYYQTSIGYFGILAIVLTACTVFLTDPTGFIFVLILIGASVFAYWITPQELPDESDSSAAHLLSVVRERLQTLPWQSGLLIAALTVALVASLFMLYPPGFGAVSGLLGAGARGLTTPRPDVPFLFPLLVILFYEPVLIALGLACCLVTAS
jgi:predicted membrane-bound mannosyltransferase